MNFGLLDQGKLNKIHKCLKVNFFFPLLMFYLVLKGVLSKKKLLHPKRVHNWLVLQEVILYSYKSIQE